MFFAFVFTFWTVVTIRGEHHTLQYLYILRSEHQHEPQFELTTVFDGLIISHCESPSLKEQPRHDWVKQAFTEEEWRSKDRFCEGEYYFHKPVSEKIQKIINITNGIIQRLRSCTEDDSAIYMSDRWGVDGEYFLSLNPTTLKWNSDSSLASEIKSEWNQKRSIKASVKDFELVYCKPTLKKLKRSKTKLLKGNLRPDVQIFAKYSSKGDTVNLQCRVSHNYLPGLRVQMTLDGKEVFKNKFMGPLPNMDGSVQVRFETETSITEPNRYHCVVDADNLHVSVAWAGQILDKRSVVQKPASGGFERNSTKNNLSLFICMAIVSISGILLISFLSLRYHAHLRHEQQIQRDNEIKALMLYIISQRKFDAEAEVDDEFYGPGVTTRYL